MTKTTAVQWAIDDIHMNSGHRVVDGGGLAK
jgi:hypothetical protein